MKQTGSKHCKHRADAVAEPLESRTLFSAVTFAAPITIPIFPSAATPQTYTSAVTADFNGDGNADFAVIDTTNHTVDVMLNKGNGSFKLSQSLPTGNEPGSLQAVALENGSVDLVFVNSQDATMEFYTGNGDGTFNTTPIVISFGSASASSVTPDTLFAADVNGDGLPDILIGTNSAIITLINQGTNGFQQQASVAGGLSNIGTFVNSSTVTDAVHALVNGQMQIYINAGAGLALSSTSAQAVPASLTNASSYISIRQVAVGDFNNDGNQDLATIISDSQTQTSFISVLLGNGDGTFEAAQLTPIPFGATNLAIGSFTNSGNEDLLVLYPNRTDVFTGTGTGTFTDANLNIPITNWNTAAVADFTGSGVVDALFGNTLLLNTSGLTATSTSIAASANPIAPGQHIKLQAAVAGRGGIPTGTVEFLDETNASNPTLLGTGTLNGAGKTSVVAVLGGKLENHDIVAEYSGNTKFAVSTSSILVESVEKNGGIPIGPTILTPTVVKETLSASTPASTKLANAAVSVKLTNSTSTDASGPVTINVYAAPTTTLNTSLDTLVATVKKSEPLKLTKSTTFSIPIKSLPANLIGGSYHLIVQTVDSAGSASAASTQTFSVAAPFISLSERIASLNLPATITNDEKLHSTLKLVVINHGNVTNDDLTIELSTSADATQAGTTFLEIKKSTNLAAGKSVTITIPIKSLPSLSVGSYFLVVQTIDANGVTTLVSSESQFAITG